MNVVVPMHNSLNLDSAPSHWKKIKTLIPQEGFVRIQDPEGFVACGPLRGVSHVGGRLIVVSARWMVRSHPKSECGWIPHPGWHRAMPDVVIPEVNQDGHIFFYEDCCRCITIEPLDQQKIDVLGKSRRERDDGLGEVFEAMSHLEFIIYGKSGESRESLIRLVRKTAEKHRLGIDERHLGIILSA